MKYNITNSNLSKVFTDLEKELEKNNETIEKILKIDKNYCKSKTNIKILKEVIEDLKEEKLDIQQEQKITISYNGNPSLTLNLCILAILVKNTVVLDYGDNWKGINLFIIQIVNNVLKNYKTEDLIYIKNNKQDDSNKIICIDDINKYNSYLREKNKNVKFCSFNYLDFYSDCDEYEEIKELIYKVAEENQIQIEGYSELEAKEAVQIMKNGFGTMVVVLTNSKDTEQIFKANIKNKKLYINKNPFKENIRLLDKKVLFM